MNNYIRASDITMHNKMEKTKNFDSDASEQDIKVNKRTKQLEDILKTREIQKKRLHNMMNHQDINESSSNTISFASGESDVTSNDLPKGFIKPKVKYTNHVKDDASLTHDPYTVPYNISNPDSFTKKNIYNFVWDAYWPFIGVGDNEPKLEIELDYVTFNGLLIEKWKTSLPTPVTTVFPIKDIFKLNLSVENGIFDFDLKLENIPVSGNSTVININPKSTSLPFNLNQFILIKDPNTITTDPERPLTNILGVIGYYNSNELCMNQFTQTVNSFDVIKNVFLSTQLFFVHISQIKHDIKITITHNTSLGENLFKIQIETDLRVDVKETFIPVIAIISPKNSFSDTVILLRTIYVNGKYFMTYANYINDVASAQQISNSVENVLDVRQRPIQLATMLLFDAVIPLINMDNVYGKTDHERILIKLYKEILKKNP